LPSLVLVKAIFVSFSPGKVANADWFGNSSSIIGSAAMKMLDRIIILTIVTLPNSRKLCTLEVVTSFNSANNRDDTPIFSERDAESIDKGMD
jgi:hypothetical protein